MKITINVTAKDILHGKWADCTSCPVALAIRRRLKDHYYFKVNSMGLDIGPLYIRFEDKVCSFIYNFDFGGSFDDKVKPFKFELNIPSRFLKTNVKNSKRKSL